MRKYLITAAALVALAAPVHARRGQPIEPIAQCKVVVNDPMDPTLSVHTRPVVNSPVVSIFENGETVNTYDRQGDLVFVQGAIYGDGPNSEGNNTKKAGWVWGSYLHGCHLAAG
jgi:hypothetical protein